MKKIKKMVLGMVLSMFVLGSSVFSCYAASSSISVDVTASKVYGKFVYGEAGHQIKVTVYYKEEDSSGTIRMDSISDVQNGSNTTAIATRANSTGYHYTWGQAFGFVDGNTVASSGEAVVK